MPIKPGHYFPRFLDETLTNAVNFSFGGYPTVKDAIQVALEVESNPAVFDIMDENMKIVYTGVTGPKTT
jgi:hypothetical protein